MRTFLNAFMLQFFRGKEITNSCAPAGFKPISLIRMSRDQTKWRSANNQVPWKRESTNFITRYLFDNLSRSIVDSKTIIFLDLLLTGVKNKRICWASTYLKDCNQVINLLFMTQKGLGCWNEIFLLFLLFWLWDSFYLQWFYFHKTRAI